MKLQSRIEDDLSETVGDQPLKFVSSEKNIFQLFTQRIPDDGFYPKMKRPEEITREDIPALIKLKKYKQLERLIGSNAPSMFESSDNTKPRLLDDMIA